MSHGSFVFAHYAEDLEVRDGAGAVFIKDTYHAAVNQNLHLDSGVVTTLSSPADVGDTVINVVSAAGLSAGDFLEFGQGLLMPAFHKIISISVNAITIDRPMLTVLVAGTTVELVIIDMAVVGTPASSLSYHIAPPPGQVWIINRILITMTHGSAGDLGLFGDIAALTNGVILTAVIDGIERAFTSWDSNGAIKNDMFDVEFDTRSGGGGIFGTSGRGSFTRVGLSAHLDGDAGDSLQILIQDNLSALDSMLIKGQGYIVNSPA